MSTHLQTSHSVEQEELLVAVLAREALNESAANLPSHISQRLANARKIALAAHVEQKQSAWSLGWLKFNPRESVNTGNHFGNWRDRAWGAFGAAPILALAFGIVIISNWQQDERIRDIAKVDSAILVDVVPPHAYKDDGYVRYLITNGKDLVKEKSNKPDEDDEEKI